MSSTLEEAASHGAVKELHLLVFNPDTLLMTILLLTKILKEHILPIRIFRLSHRVAGGETNEYNRVSPTMSDSRNSSCCSTGQAPSNRIKEQYWAPSP